jgi:dTDP-4-dehydrorhamnose reductase
MILVTGANGQLGQCFQQLAVEFPKAGFVFASASDLDVGKKQSINTFFKLHPGIRWVINCAAYTAVDKAESEVARARRINTQGPKNLAIACAAHGAFLIHFSTDYVYHHRQNTAYREHDPVHPRGVYARTKLAGEKAAQQVYPEGVMVIRTSWVYSEFGHNFVKTMLRLGRERTSIQVVADQIGTPTYAPDLARAVYNIVEQVQKGAVSMPELTGIWHYSNEGVASWYDFAQAIFELQQLPCTVAPIPTSHYPTPAQRPPFSVLDKTKIKAAFGLNIPYWRHSLAVCLKNMAEGGN